MSRSLFIFLSIFIFSKASAGDKIKYYFNHPVDNSVARSQNAVYLNKCMGDTIVAYINRSKYTLDIAVYNYTSTFPAIATAVNNAKSRGVIVRWIYDAAQSNTGLPLLNSSIPQLGSPQTSDYTIMHNKFMVIDANSTNASDAIVWTGSSNWNTQQFNFDYNNCLVIQDAPLAKAYVAEFNMMWGGSGATPNSATSKFGQYKTDLGSHSFTIDGHNVELYFSPSDHTNDHILTAINSGDKDLYFGMYTFTLSSDASALVDKFNAGVYVAGIEDVSSNTSSPYSLFMSSLGTDKFKIYDGPGYNIYHNKFLIVDPSDECSDPQVVTGSHNWSYSADTKNDENTLIIHDKVAANIYYQSFKANFADMGGTLSSVGGCTSGIADQATAAQGVNVFPNPAGSSFTISYQLATAAPVTIEVYNVIGQKVVAIANNEAMTAGSHSHTTSISTPGIYFLKMTAGNSNITQRIVVTN